MCHFNETSLEFQHSVAHTVCSLTLALVGSFGNASSIYLIWRGRLYNSRIMALLTNLCLANLILTSVILPLLSINSFQAGWRYGEAFCQIFAYTLYVTLLSEIINLIQITIYQYLVVVQNLTPSTSHYPGHRVRLTLTLLMPWLFSMAVYLLPLTRAWDQFGFDPRIHMCTLINLTGIWGMKSTISGGLLLVSTLIIVYCYASIFMVHHRSRRKTAPPLQRTSSRAVSQNRRNTQLIRMIGVIFVNFGITYIPFMIMYLADPCLSRTPSSAVVAIIYLSFSHSATNPIIYALMNKQILTQWREVLGKCLKIGHMAPDADLTERKDGQGLSNRVETLM